MTNKKKIAAVIAIVAFAVIMYAESARGQYARYTTRPVVGANNCATGNCPTAVKPVATATPAVKKESRSESQSADKTEKATSAQASDSAEKETKIVEPTAAEPGVESEGGELPNAYESPSNNDAAWETPNVNAAVETAGELGEVKLVYPATAQSSDEVVAFAARRAREPVAEDGEPLDTETPIGSIRNVGARLKELTSAIEAQQETIDALAAREGGDSGAVLDAIKKFRESDESFQKDTRESLASVLENIKKRNETFIGEQVKKAVTPEPATYWKWIALAFVGLTILIIWFIIVIKIIGWCVSLGRNSIAKVVESTISATGRAIKADKSQDEITL